MKIVAASGLIVVAIVILLFSFSSGSSESGSDGQMAFYSSDDGATWFKDSAALIPPFEHKGKSAVQAFVFAPVDGKAPHVRYLQRYTEAEKKRLAADPKATPDGMTGVEVKRPGAGTNWVARNTKDAMILANTAQSKDAGSEVPVIP